MTSTYCWPISDDLQQVKLRTAKMTFIYDMAEKKQERSHNTGFTGNKIMQIKLILKLKENT